MNEVSKLSTVQQFEATELSVSTTSKSKDENLKKKLVPVNINIRKDQRDWLSTTAELVRDNNVKPVAPGERVFPKHLIEVAIDLLRASKVDWSQVENIEDLRKQLNI
jgi:hypothetical protein